MVFAITSTFSLLLDHLRHCMTMRTWRKTEKFCCCCVTRLIIKLWLVKMGPQVMLYERYLSTLLLPRISRRPVHPPQSCTHRLLEASSPHLSMMATPAKLQFVDPSVSFPAIEPTSQIRLLLLSSDRQESITCRLHVVSMSEPPPYEALSYVWGSEEDLQVLRVDGHEFGVTQNLYAALNQLLLPDGAVRVLWIDAICINQGAGQSDLAERSHQVRLMSRIFSSATSVVAYLGESYPGLYEAIEFLTVAADGQQSYVDWLTNSADCNISQICQALIPFFNRPWWSRVWTIQEHVVAHKASFQFGRLEIDFDIVRRGINNIFESTIQSPSAYAKLDPISKESLSTAYTKLSTLSLPDTRESLLNALGAFRNRSSGDPRDKIYSLMGLFHESDQVVNIDYTIPTEHLFKDFTLAWIQKHQNLEVLGHLHDPARRVHKDMPSFAIDWSYQPSLQSIGVSHHRSIIQNEAFDACKGSKAIWHLEPAGHVRANGFIFDSIEAIGAKRVLEFGSSWATNISSTLPDIVDMAIQRGGDSDQTLMAIWLTLCMECKLEGGAFSRLRSEDEKRTLSEWWDNILEPTAPTAPRAETEGLFSDAKSIGTTMWTASLERSFIFTKGGHMGLAPDWCRPGDAIAIMGGGAVPMVLRPVVEVVGQRGDTPVFEVIGEAYVHGVMDGQAFEDNGRTGGDFDDIYLV